MTRMRVIVFIVILVQGVMMETQKTEETDKFKKDLHTDVQFPPLLDRPREGIPMGHLRPLGWQRLSEGRVDEETNIVSGLEFWDKYVNTSTPVTLRGLVSKSPAINLWTDTYMANSYSQLEVWVYTKKEDLRDGPQKMSLKKFLRYYHFENWYLMTILPGVMMKDVPFPSILTCPGLSDHLIEPGLWFSAGNTASLLHSHGDHSIHCQLDGRKDFIIIAGEYGRHVGARETYSHADDYVSDMDVDMVNVFKYQKVSTVPWRWTTLRQGDCVFIPAGYLHQVRGYGRSVSVTVSFAPQPHFDLTGCEANHAASFESMDKVETRFVWKYTHGDKHLTLTKLYPEDVRHFLAVLMRDDSHLYFDRFQRFYDEVMSEIDDHKTADELWKEVLDPTDDGLLDRNDVLKRTDKELQPLVYELQKAAAFHSAKHDEL